MTRVDALEAAVLAPARPACMSIGACARQGNAGATALECRVDTAAMHTAAQRARRVPWVGALAVLLLAAAWFGPLEYRDLFHPDEGRYSEIAAEMAASGDWVTPRLNGLKYLEKPPLQYWATAAAFRWLGPDEWTARLWPSLLGFLGIAAVFGMGRVLHSTATGIVAACMLASSFLYVVLAQLITLDMGLTFFMSGAVFAAILAGRESIGRARRRWALLAWTAMALAVLSKGLVGVLLPMTALLADAMLARDARYVRALHWPAGVALFSCIVLPWVVLVQLRNPEFLEFFVVHEHFARYVSAEHHRPGPWFYFVPVLIAGCLPWSAAMLTGWLAAVGRMRHPREMPAAERLLGVWVVVVVVFFSASTSKLAGYVLPVFPALALLAARALIANPGRARWSARGVASTGVALVIAFPLFPTIVRGNEFAAEMGAFAPWLAAGGAAMLAGVALATRVGRADIVRSTTALAAGTLVGLQILMMGAQTFATIYTAEPLMERAKAIVGGFGDVPFFSVEMYDQTMPLHLDHPVTLVAFGDELTLGEKAEPYRAIDTLERFREVWSALPDAFAVMPVRRYEAERAAGTAMQVLSRDPRRVLVRKPGSSVRPIARPTPLA